MSSRELTEWEAFSLVEPFGDRRGDLQAAVIASTIANVNRGRSKKPYDLMDFIPEYGPSDQATNDTASLLSMVSMYGGGDEGGEITEEDHDPSPDGDGERLRGEGENSDNGQDGMGGIDSPAGRDT